MSAVSTIKAGRAAAERLMLDTIAVYRVTREWDEPSGEYAEATETVYLGPGKFQFFDAAYEQTPEAGGHAFVQARSFVHLPASTTGIQVDDVAVSLESPLAPAIEGVEHRITSVPLKSLATSLRLPVEKGLA